MVQRQTTERLAGLLDFSRHSLPQPYGRWFLRRVLLRHPLRSISGIWRYLRQPQPDAGQHQLTDSANSGFVPGAMADPTRLLVATGFCQKPLPFPGRHNGCPAGRFNHDCLYLDHLRLGPPAEAMGEPACEDCLVRVLGQAALRAGACFAILTSALDIANDVLLPALEEQRFTHCLVTLCPYSLEPMALALSICHMDGYVMAFDTGVCADFHQWLRADQGIKLEQTTLPEERVRKIFHLLNSVAELTLRPRESAFFQRKGNIYQPEAPGSVKQ